jgi:hypothetical protein
MPNGVRMDTKFSEIRFCNTPVTILPATVTQFVSFT